MGGRLYGRSLSLPIINITMTTIRIALPIYKYKNWEPLSEQGILEVCTSPETDTLSDSYEKLKPQIAELMANVQAECRIVVELQQVQNELLQKQSQVESLCSKIKRANRQLERLTRFLSALGISASDLHLNITTKAIAEFRPVELIDTSVDDSEEVENNPIPFNCLDDDDHDDDHDSDEF